MPDMRSFDDLVARCESMQWGYEIGCYVEYADPISGGAKVALMCACRAEVTEQNGTTITVDDASTGREALERAVAGMERVIAGKVTAGREG